MQSGKIVRRAAAALFDDPVDRFAAFIGSPSMNFLPLRLTADGLALKDRPTLNLGAATFLDQVHARQIDQIVWYSTTLHRSEGRRHKQHQRVARQTPCHRIGRDARRRRRRPDHQGQLSGEF
jgi:hypothetical protein